MPTDFTFKVVHSNNKITNITVTNAETYHDAYVRAISANVHEPGDIVIPAAVSIPNKSTQAKAINEIWMEKCKMVLNARDAAIIFAFGMDKDRRVTIFATQDLTPVQIAFELTKIRQNILDL